MLQGGFQGGGLGARDISSFWVLSVPLTSGTKKKPGNQKPWNWKSEILKNSRTFDNCDSLVHELHEKWWNVLLFWCDSKLIRNRFCMEKGDLHSPWGSRGIHEFSRDFSKILDSRRPVQTAVSHTKKNGPWILANSQGWPSDSEWPSACPLTDLFPFPFGLSST